MSKDSIFNKEKEYVVAIDLGASNGRIIMAYLEDSIFHLQEVHRFENAMRQDDGDYTWDVDAIFKNIIIGLKKISHLKIKSIGVDTWGVDYVLIGNEGQVLDKVYAYRDDRTKDSFVRLRKEIGDQKLYDKTGIQLMTFNTLYQLKAHVKQNPGVFKQTANFLMMPDFFHYKLCGIVSNEFTQFSTSQLLSAKTREIDDFLIDYIGIDKKIFPPLRISGDTLGNITEEIRSLTGLSKDVQVIVPGTHDTASSVVGSIGGENSVYISSGTWSLMGVSTDSPVINPLSFNYEFSNEGGVYKTNRLLKNIMGLWIVNQVTKEIAPHTPFDEIVAKVEESPPFKTLINPNDDIFMNPHSMVEAIQDYTRYTGQEVPQEIGEIARCIYESLALLYQKVLLELEEITGKTYTSINIVGGGSKNTFLNQLTANITERTVIAGPIETSALGNILIQMITLGLIPDVQTGKDIIKSSEKYPCYSCRKVEGLAEVQRTFNELIKCKYRKEKI